MFHVTNPSETTTFGRYTEKSIEKFKEMYVGKSLHFVMFGGMRVPNVCLWKRAFSFLILSIDSHQESTFLSLKRHKVIFTYAILDRI